MTTTSVLAPAVCPLGTVEGRRLLRHPAHLSAVLFGVAYAGEIAVALR